MSRFDFAFASEIDFVFDFAFTPAIASRPSTNGPKWKTAMKLFRPCFTLFFGFAATLLVLATAPRCAAQAIPDADKAADVSAFLGYEYADPAYGPPKNNGTGFGLNYTRYFPIPVAPSIEARVNLTNGTDVKERTYLAGLQAKARVFRRYHPYADFLVGTGTIHFNTRATGYIGDNSTIYNYGGGLDFDLIHHFALRADIQRQNWALGGSPTFHPVILLFGVNYTIPFRDYKDQRDLNP